MASKYLKNLAKKRAESESSEAAVAQDNKGAITSSGQGASSYLKRIASKRRSYIKSIYGDDIYQRMAEQAEASSGASSSIQNTSRNSYEILQKIAADAFNNQQLRNSSAPLSGRSVPDIHSGGTLSGLFEIPKTQGWQKSWQNADTGTSLRSSSTQEIADVAKQNAGKLTGSYYYGHDGPERLRTNLLNNFREGTNQILNNGAESRETYEKRSQGDPYAKEYIRMGQDDPDNPLMQYESLRDYRSKQGTDLYDVRNQAGQEGQTNQTALKYTDMTPEEKDTYNYLYGRYGKAEAERYHTSILGSKTGFTGVNQRTAERTYNDSVRNENVMQKAGRSFGAGVNSALEGIPQALNAIAGNPNVSPEGTDQYLSQYIRSDADNSRAQQVLYDIASSTGYMVPGIVTSSVLGPAAGAGVAQAAGNAVFAAAQAGNSYAEALGEGHDVKSAQVYSAQQAVDETATNILLGGIEKFGRGVIPQLMRNSAVGQSMRQGILSIFKNPTAKAIADKAFDRIFDAGGEAAQEYLQFFTENATKNFLWDAGESMNPLDPDAWYAAALGALNSLALNAPGDIAGAALNRGSREAAETPDTGTSNDQGQKTNDNVMAAQQMLESMAEKERGEETSVFEQDDAGRMADRAIQSASEDMENGGHADSTADTQTEILETVNAAVDALKERATKENDTSGSTQEEARAATEAAVEAIRNEGAEENGTGVEIMPAESRTISAEETATNNQAKAPEPSFRDIMENATEEERQEVVDAINKNVYGNVSPLMPTELRGPDPYAEDYDDISNSRSAEMQNAPSSGVPAYRTELFRRAEQRFGNNDAAKAMYSGSYSAYTNERLKSGDVDEMQMLTEYDDGMAEAYAAGLAGQPLSSLASYADFTRFDSMVPDAVDSMWKLGYTQYETNRRSRRVQEAEDNERTGAGTGSGEHDVQSGGADIRTDELGGSGVSGLGSHAEVGEPVAEAGRTEEAEPVRLGDSGGHEELHAEEAETVRGGRDASPAPEENGGADAQDVPDADRQRVLGRHGGGSDQGVQVSDHDARSGRGGRGVESSTSADNTGEGRETRQKAEEPEKKPAKKRTGKRAPKEAVTPAEKAEQQSAIASQEKPKGNDFVLTPEAAKAIPTTESARVSANVDAIRTMKDILDNGRIATPEEQKILSKFTGWGGISDAKWKQAEAELSGVLTKEELDHARASLTDAYYTHPDIISGIYDGIAKIGFNGGRLLEPSAGVGRFIGAMPSSMLPSVKSWMAVELDTVSGNIARHLYPNADVRIQGLENANIINGYMDAVIGNIPFGDYGVTDIRYPKFITSKIHNYFIARSLDTLRPGGIAVLITSSGTLDASRGQKVRQYFAEKADLIGAVRLPNTAFQGTGTKVVSDILIFKKRAEGTLYKGERFIDVGYTNKGAKNSWDSFPVNEYFSAHPDMMLGTPEYARTQYGMQVTVNPDEKVGPLGEQISNAIGKITAKMEYPLVDSHKEAVRVAKEARNKKNGTAYKKDGKVFLNQNGEEVEISGTTREQRIYSDAVDIRDTAKKLFGAMQTGKSDAEIAVLRKRLNDQYDAFSQKNRGGFHNQAVHKVLGMDTDYAFLQALEKVTKVNGRNMSVKGDVFFRNTINPQVTVTHVDTIADGITESKNRTGRVDPKLIAELMGTTVKGVEAELDAGNAAFRDADGNFVSSEVYLSGNVRAKLKKAEMLAEGNPLYKKNVRALEEVVPKFIHGNDISINMGVTWIPPEYYARFAEHLMNAPEGSIEVTYQKSGGYAVGYGKYAPSLRWRAENTTVWGTKDMPFLYDGARDPGLLWTILNNKNISVTSKDSFGKTVHNVAAENALKTLKDKVNRVFNDWVWQDAERTKLLEETYNDSYNAMAMPHYSGDVSIPGQSSDITLRTHQGSAVNRIVQSPYNTLLQHGVGAGKTFAACASVMKLRQLGLATKPCIVVQKQKVSEWNRDFHKLFPLAKVLMADATTFSKANRKEFVNRIASSDIDAVIISYEQFQMIPMSDEYQEQYEQSQLDQILAVEQSVGKEKTTRQLESAKKRAQKRIAEINNMKRDTDNITFEETGIDYLFVDEAQNYKNLAYFTNLSGVADMGNPTGSNRANDMKMKTDYMRGKQSGKGVTFLTATPIMNSPVEAYNMLRYLMDEELEKRGIHNLDDFINMFGNIEDITRQNAAGSAWVTKTTFNGFVNMREWHELWGTVVDSVKTEDIPGIKLPKMKTGDRIVVKCKAGEAAMDVIHGLGERLQHKDTKGENHIFKIQSDGKKASFSQRMIDPSLPYGAEEKVPKAVGNIYNIWKETETFTGTDGETHQNGTQLVFCDYGTPKKAKGAADVTEDAAYNPNEEISVAGVNVYQDMKDMLVAKGIPPEQIAFIQDYKTDEQKDQLYEQVRNGDVRILIGSSKLMGEGLNVQTRIAAIHEMNPLMRPGDVTQAEGRGIRQGNLNPEVGIYVYVTEETFDTKQWDALRVKGSYLEQIETGTSDRSVAYDTSDFGSNAGEIMAIASGNPLLKEQADTNDKVRRLQGEANEHRRRVFEARRDMQDAQDRVMRLKEMVPKYRADITRVRDITGNSFNAVVAGKTYDNREEFGKAVITYASKLIKDGADARKIGKISGFDIYLDGPSPVFADLRGEASYRALLNLNTANGVAAKITNLLKTVPKELEKAQETIKRLQSDIPQYQKMADSTFEKQAELDAALQRSREIEEQLKKEPVQAAAEETDSKASEPEEGVLERRTAPVTADTRKITMQSTEQERYEILRDKVITIPKVDTARVTADIEESISRLDENRTLAKKLFNKIAKDFGALGQYRNEDIGLEFTFGSNGVIESAYKQNSKTYRDLALVFSNMEGVVENAVGIEVHNRNAEGYKPNEHLKAVYVLASAIEDGERIIPVKLEVKEFDSNPNTLYVAVALEALKKSDFDASSTSAKRLASTAPSLSIVKIAELLGKIKATDKNFIKYIPKQFLAPENTTTENRLVSSETSGNGETKAANTDGWWADTNQGSTVKAPERISDIIGKAAHDFGFNVTSGTRYVKGAGSLGQFNERNRGIRTKITNDLPTLSHEFGHWLDANLEISTDEKLPADVAQDISAAFKKDPENEEAYKGAKPDILRKEGLAEFMRYYLQNRDTARIDYPALSDYILKRMDPQDLAKLNAFADQVNAYYSMDAGNAKSAIRLKEDSMPDYRSPAEKLRDNYHHWYQLWVDSNHGFRKFDMVNGTDTHIYATNAAYSDTRVTQTIMEGIYDFDGKYVGPGLRDALWGIDTEDAGTYTEFGEYLDLRHGIEWLAHGKRVFADDRKNNERWMRARMKDIEIAHPEFAAAAKRVYQFQRDFMWTYGVGQGLISAESYRTMLRDYPEYVPFFRAGFRERGNALMKAKGSGRDLIHPVDNIIDSVTKLMNLADRNGVLLKLRNAAIQSNADAMFMERIPDPQIPVKVDLRGIKGELTQNVAARLEDMDVSADVRDVMQDTIDQLNDTLVQFQLGRAKTNRKEIRILVDGKPEFWKVNDQLLFDSISSMDYRSVNGVVNAFGKISRFMTANITGNNAVWSIFSNAPRDIQTLFTYSMKTKQPVKILKAVGEAYVNSVRHEMEKSVDPLWSEYMAMGGGDAGVWSGSRDYVKDLRKMLNTSRKHPERNPVKWAQFVSDTIESGPRFATYKIYRSEGMSPQKAFHAAMDITVNFRRNGINSKTMNNFIPFFNAGVQAADKMVRYFTAEDLRQMKYDGGKLVETNRKARGKAAVQRIAFSVAVSAVMAAINYALNHRDDKDKENYELLSNYMKNSYYVIPLGNGKYFSVPKAQGIATLESFFERALEAGMEGNSHAFDEYAAYWAENSLPSIASDIAQFPVNAANSGLQGASDDLISGTVGSFGAAGEMAQLFANKDYLGRPIVGSAYENKEPRAQYNARTSELAYLIGQAFNMSPQKVDHFARNVFGWMWTYQAAVFPIDDRKGVKGRRDLTLGVGSTYVRDPLYSNDIGNWIYDKAEESARKYNTYGTNAQALESTLDADEKKWYQNVTNLTREDSESEENREIRRKALKELKEYRSASESGKTPDEKRKIFGLVEQTGDTSILPGTMQTSIKAGGKEYKLGADEYMDFQNVYEDYYWDYANDVSASAENEKKVKEIAKDMAIDRILSKRGVEYEPDGDKALYDWVNSGYDFSDYFDYTDEIGDIKDQYEKTEDRRDAVRRYVKGTGLSEDAKKKLWAIAGYKESTYSGNRH